jgi:hypothetical protein
LFIKEVSLFGKGIPLFGKEVSLFIKEIPLNFKENLLNFIEFGGKKAQKGVFWMEIRLLFPLRCFPETCLRL